MPNNLDDANAVAVFAGANGGATLRIGYLRRQTAAKLAPLLDELNFDAYRVNTSGPIGERHTLEIDAPAPPALRECLAERANNGETPESKMLQQ